MSASTVADIGDLLRDMPDRPGDWPTQQARVAWHTRKAELLSRIADDAADNPGLVNPAEARAAAEQAWAQVEEMTTNQPAEAGKETP